MINFKEQNGLLFKMLDKPTPLTPDAEMPCLTRLIQDDSRMGMFNRDTKPSRLSDFYLAARIVSNNIIVDEFMESDYNRFEIIGTLVAEGSAEWALYQMMQGKKVFNSNRRSFFHYFEIKNGWIAGQPEGFINLNSKRPDEWIEWVGAKSGWEIYEEPKKSSYDISITNRNWKGLSQTWCGIPAHEADKIADSLERIVKSEPAPFAHVKVGDWVEHKESKEQGTITHISTPEYGTIEVKIYDEVECYSAIDFYNNFIILKPSEVIVEIGCLSGTVERHYENPKYWFKLRSSEYNYALISIEMLDAQTRELVEGLLKDMQKQMDKHYDRHNEGICAVCGCTVSPWEYRCRSCRNKVAEDVAKEKEQKPEVKE